jgi:hypothetical protein
MFLRDMLELQKLREQTLKFALQMIEYRPPPSYAEGGTFGTHQEGGGERQEQKAPTGGEIDLDFEVVSAT